VEEEGSFEEERQERRRHESERGGPRVVELEAGADAGCARRRDAGGELVEEVDADEENGDREESGDASDEAAGPHAGAP
jgi:hypothetical protein